MIMNEKIKASEVLLIGLQGEDLGIVKTQDALQMAKEHKVDLVCHSLVSSPPRCELIAKGNYKAQQDQEKKKSRQAEKGMKIKEIRLSAYIEDHDYDTKKRQAERVLTSMNGVQLVVLLEKKEGELAKELVEKLVKDLKHVGKQDKGIQVSGKKVVATIHPL
ncbi:translation initiation factor IF-3 [Brevibacillus daliensis]|uniref:translation initiation factor IF-3 n=1 Tax=Brevibacillus daliensis TaxID=2892995 RepID=UPI001E4619C5|nr:translation initiation factor IF-3 [Brevibacillus daliensis]